jgi:hypothetical protein
MADGTTKDIEDIEAGDEVQALDPETGESGPRKVVRRIVTDDDKHFNELSIATKDGVETLTATHEHPFWSPSEQDWIEAGKLEPGMTLLTDEGDTLLVTGNRAYTQRARTYNMTVADLHTYYVLAGRTPVLRFDWGRVVRDLVASDWVVEFSTTHPRGEELLRSGASELFGAHEESGEDSATLAVRVDRIWFTSYFFDRSEIEFTFDPRDVVDQSGLAAVESFMKTIGDACGKPVVMTMESSTDHRGRPALLEYRP